MESTIHNIQIYPCTLSETMTDDAITINPSRTGKLCLNGIEASLGNVVYASERVDLSVSKKRRVYLVEHALAFCAIFGIHSADIRGCCREWDFHRPTHEEASASGFSPSDVLGLPTGQIWGTSLCSMLKHPTNTSPIEFIPIGRELTYEAEKGACITLFPPKDPNLLSVRCAHGDEEVVIYFHPQKGVTDPDLIPPLLLSRSVGLTRVWNRESLMHAAGDVLSDVYWLGRVMADIKIVVAPYYHQATIGIVKELHRSMQ